MSAPLREWLRPSALPKLALCGQFRGDPKSGAAAERGTKLDVAFRALIEKQNVDVSELDEAEREALRWAEKTALLLADSKPLIADESFLKVEVLGMTGTADLLCPDGFWSADLKSGQNRNYVEQQAAYALGFMDLYFADEWTVYLLFCDIPELVTLRFTREEAEAIVKGVLLKAVDDAPATPNDYCGWCAQRFDCEARKEMLGIVPFEGTRAIEFHTAPSPTLRDFVLACKVVEGFAEQAREILLMRIAGGEKVGGVSLVNRKGSRKFEAADLAPLVTCLGAEKVLGAFGLISADKAKELWDQTQMPWPSEKVKDMPGSSSIRVGRPKPKAVEPKTVDATSYYLAQKDAPLCDQDGGME